MYKYKTINDQETVVFIGVFHGVEIEEIYDGSKDFLDWLNKLESKKKNWESNAVSARNQDIRNKLLMGPH